MTKVVADIEAGKAAEEAAEKGAAEKAAVEKASADKAKAEKAAAGKLGAEKAAREAQIKRDEAVALHLQQTFNQEAAKEARRTAQADTDLTSLT